jgi:hypothetical protein
MKILKSLHILSEILDLVQVIINDGGWIVIYIVNLL